MRPALATVSAALGAAVLMAAAAIPARAQAFTELKTALVDYSKADMAPSKPCEALGKFKSKEIAQIAAAQIMAATTPTAAGAPAHCRVTGLLSPEIAFEVSLPPLLHDRQRRPRGRGTGRSRPGRAARRSVAAWVRLRADQHGHDARNEGFSIRIAI